METSQLHNPKRRSTFRRFLSLIFLLAVLAAGVWAVLNRQFVIDQITVWQFKPSAEITALSRDASLNDHGTFLFYASQPELQSATDFNSNCKTRETQSIVLGCYTNHRIFVFEVTDSRIVGVKTVTAAHEMLHAAYERLSSAERDRVDKLLEAQLAKTEDQDMLDLVALYDKLEPGERWNELHSIFGTEVAQLSGELETYYKQYFTDRSQVVAAYTHYHQVFTDLKAQATTLQDQLSSKKATIDSKTIEYDTKLAQLESDIKAFNQRAATTGGFASQAEFSRARASLMTRQSALTALAQQINALVAEYNRIVGDLNAVGIEINELNDNLNSQSQSIGS